MSYWVLLCDKLPYNKKWEYDLLQDGHLFGLRTARSIVEIHSIVAIQIEENLRILEKKYMFKNGNNETNKIAII